MTLYAVVVILIMVSQDILKLKNGMLANVFERKKTTGRKASYFHNTLGRLKAS
jgi:hypothetical protein